MQASEKLFLQTVGRFVADRFKAWALPITERIEKIERALTSPPNNLTNEQAEEVRRMIAEAFGQDHNNAGDPDAEIVTADMVDAKIAGALAAQPHLANVYVDRAGDLYLSYSDGSTFKAGHVVGADADPAKIYETIKAEVAKLPPPKDGADGLGFEDLSVGFDGERTITFKFARGDKVQEFSISPPWPLFRGIWREGKYQAGDTATHEGSTWAALADTDSRPGTPNSQWQLTNKRGRDGREGKAGPPGSAGKDGRDGRDLTQLGPDGRKW